MTEDRRTLRLGQPVPDFKLATYEPATAEFGEISLSRLREEKKWAIIFFYPADFTFVCATEFSALAELYDEFKALGAEIITVSTDSKEVHLAWRNSEGELEHVLYPMAADRTGEVSRLFGVYDEQSGNALRGTFIISPEGILLNSEVNFYNLGRNIDELMRKLKANVYLKDSPAEVCPAKWKSAGDRTLKPSAGLVGHVHEALND
jgi:peroxiredoxin (alkyl hydroperoxide reductase subunit C)